MKTKIKLLTITMIISLLIGCQKEPTACIDASSNSVYSGETVTFKSCSIDASSQKWVSDNGATSTEREYTYKYTNIGTRKMTLEVYSKNGRKMASTSTTIIVKPLNQKYAGTYTTNNNCDPGTLFNITINPVGESQIKIIGFLGICPPITANMNGPTFTILPMSLTYENYYRFDIKSGTGTFNNNTISFSITFDLIDLTDATYNSYNNTCDNSGTLLP